MAAALVGMQVPAECRLLLQRERLSEVPQGRMVSEESLDLEQEQESSANGC